MKIDLTDAELEILTEALDSHAYWQLSDENYRNDGFLIEPGSDDPEVVAQIRAALKLLVKLGEKLK